MTYICDSICIGEWLFLLLWFISVPTYCVVIYTIVKKRRTKFKEEFWLLAIALFVADLLHLCQYMWGMKLPRWGLVPAVFLRAPRIIGWLMLVPQPPLLCAEFMGLMFLSYNRYVAIMKPLQYDMVSIFFAVVLGMGGWVRIGLFAFLYVRMFHHVYKENRKGHNQRSSTLNRAEYNLAIMGSVLALCDMAITLHAFHVAYELSISGVSMLDANDDKVRLLAFQMACLTDIFGWMNGWLLLVCCQQVRKEFLKQFGYIKQPQVRPTLTTKKNTRVRATSKL